MTPERSRPERSLLPGGKVERIADRYVEDGELLWHILIYEWPTTEGEIDHTAVLEGRDRAGRRVADLRFLLSALPQVSGQFAGMCVRVRETLAQVQAARATALQAQLDRQDLILAERDQQPLYLREFEQTVLGRLTSLGWL